MKYPAGLTDIFLFSWLLYLQQFTDFTEETKSETEKLRLLLAKGEEVPKGFILRARVLKLYRQSLRVAHRAPAHPRAELKNTIRQEIEKNRHCDDKQQIRFLIGEGLEKLKGLDEMLDMQGN